MRECSPTVQTAPLAHPRPFIKQWEATKPLPAMSQSSVDAVRELEGAVLRMPQASINTEHAFHAGLYARTIMIPAGVVLTGAEIKIDTVLIISGHALVFGDAGPVELTGYHVTLGDLGRKQAFYALEDTWLTMLFATKADSVDEAEQEFTDEYEMLMSRKEV